MQWTSWIGLALGVVMISAAKVGPPPVMLDLGPVVPTPAPSPRTGERMRLITTITVQNSPDGESVVSFEATDVADEDHGKFRTLAAKNYSLAEEKPGLKALRERIIRNLRGIERDMLEFAERTGPPREREPLQPGAAKPY
jgi:hypothetical protein